MILIILKRDTMDMLLVNRIRDIINKIIPVLTITQKVIGILLMVISFCLLFPLLQEKYSYNDMTTSIIYIFFFIALLIYNSSLKIRQA